MAYLLAGSPTKLSLVGVKATIDGVVLYPSEFSIILGLPASIIAIHEFVVPKSIPITFLLKATFYIDLNTYFEILY